MELEIMKEEGIIFETINNTDFEKMTSKSVDDFEKEYDSLREELLDKCHPNNFILYLTSDKEKFEIANEIYGVLMNNNSLTDDELVSLRNRAISELGIHISTKKLYNKLVDYFSPEIYTSIIPYNEERVSKAGYYYAKILDAKNDILALENIEKEASDFIAKRNYEIELQKDIEKRKRIEVLERERKKEKEDIRSLVIATAIWILIFLFISIIAVLK